MNKEEALKYLEEKGDSNFVLRTEEDDTTYLGNLKKQTEEAYDKTVVPEKIKAVHDYYDKDYEDVTGRKKEPTEKTYAFGKKILKEYFDKAQKSDVLAGEIETLKKKISDGSNDEQLKLDYEKAKSDYNNLKESTDTRINTLNTDHDKYKVEFGLRTDLSGLTFDAKTPAEALSALQDKAIKEIIAMAKIIDGKVVYLNEDGTTRTNVNNRLEPYTGKELLAERLKSVLGEVAGKKPDVSGEALKEYDDDGKIKKVSLIVPDSVNTKIKLGEHLVSKGILRNTPEYKLAYKEYSVNMPLQ